MRGVREVVRLILICLFAAAASGQVVLTTTLGRNVPLVVRDPSPLGATLWSIAAPLAMLTGQADINTTAVPIVRAPFTATGATITPLQITGGRGAGAVRMRPAAYGAPPIPPLAGDLSVVKTAPSTAIAGLPITFTITVTNNGPTSAPNVTVEDALPAGLTLLSASTTIGTCNNASPVMCSIPSLSLGATATITINAFAASPGTITNTATATSSADPVLANNSGSVTVTIVPAAAGAEVPAASTWALIALGSLLAIAAFRRMT